MAISYFVGFDLSKRNAAGIYLKQPITPVQVSEPNGGKLITTLASDDFGVVDGGSLSVVAGTEVEFSVTGFTKKIQRTTRASLADCFEVEQNLVLEDLFVSALTPASFVEIWMSEPDGSNARLIGYARRGETLKFDYNPKSAREVRFYIVSRGGDGSYSDQSLSDAGKQDFEITPNMLT